MDKYLPKNIKINLPKTWLGPINDAISIDWLVEIFLKSKISKIWVVYKEKIKKPDVNEIVKIQKFIFL